MCGRFAFCSPHEAVTRLFGVAGVADVERLDRLLVPWAAAGLVARPVSRRVNDA